MLAKRKRTDTLGSAVVNADDAGPAAEVGQGLQVKVPPSVPHLYNNAFTVKLTYADNYRHSFNYGTSSQQVFRMNSIYDPDYTGIGHQPMMRDLWASMYDYYAVMECEYEIVLCNVNAGSLISTASGNNLIKPYGSQASFVRSCNLADFNTSTTVYPIAEQKNTTTKFLAPEGMITFTGNLTQGDFILDAKDADDDKTWIAIGANPGIPRYFGYVLTSAQWAAMPGQNITPFIEVQAYVKLHYTVQFTQVNSSLRTVPS